MVSEAVRCSDGTTSRKLARNQSRQAHADCRAHRIRQDARGISFCDRRFGLAGDERKSRGRNSGRLCLAVESSQQRYSDQLAAAVERHSAESRSQWRKRYRDSHVCAYRRHAGKGSCGHDKAAAAHYRHHPRVALHPAHQRRRPAHVKHGSHVDRR